MSLQGTVKLFRPESGFGFITSAEGTDVFLHIKDVVPEGSVPQKGDVVAYDVQESKIKPGQMQASNVTGATGTAGAKGGGKGSGVVGTGAFTGACKQYNGDKGFGFIIGEDGTDIFLHVGGMVDGSTPQKGDQLQFDIEESKLKPGQLQATNITGGTGWGKGDGKGFGKAKGGWGGWGGWGGDDGWGGDSWGAPYGKGKGKGKDGGKGKGKDMWGMMGGWGW